MIRLSELKDVLSLYKERKLELRDGPVLDGLIAHINWRTGRSQVSAAGLARMLGIRPDNCRQSLSRLRAQGLVIYVVNRDTGESYYLVNPSLVFAGTPKQRGYLWQQFRAAIETQLGSTGEIG